MKILFLVITFCIVFNANGQKVSTAVLNVSIAENISIPNKASLEIRYFDRDLTNVEEQIITGRKIIIKKLLKEPVLAYLTLSWEGKKSMRLRFFLPVDTGEVAIGANNKINFAYKNEQKLFIDFSDYEKQVINLKNAAVSKIKDVNFENRIMINVQKEIDSIEKHYANLIDDGVYKKLINQQKDSFLGVHSLLEYAERPYEHQRRKFETDSILIMYESFTPEMKKLPSMQTLHKLLLSEKAISLGHNFPTFILNDKSSKQLELTKFYGKYTLIDFWANWCTPCRAENPNLINQYNKYSNKGLVILSVSIDKVADKNLWLEAINKDGIGLWPNFIDADENAKQQLNIRFIPTNYLIDRSGKIIARNLMGDALNAKLEELFKN